MLRLFCVLGGAVVVAQAALAQELVVNGGLEQFARCPEGPVTKRLKVDGKVNAAQGNPDLYSACSSTFGVPTNWSGSQAAWEGNTYAGLVLTSDFPLECGSREYLQFPLLQPLENGRRYRLTFRVSAAEHSGYATDRVGAIFSGQDLSPKGVTGQLREHASVENPLGRILNDTTGWTTVSGVYNAKGGERFVLIGNFHPCNSSTRIRMDGDKKSSMKRKNAARMDPVPQRGGWHEWIARTAYAYLDGVSLVADTTAPEHISELDEAHACIVDDRPAIGPELIPDPGFAHNEHPKPNSWRNASDGTPDFLDQVTGLYLFSAAYTDNREYIRIPLADTLSPCTTYRIAFDVRRNVTYAYAVDAIGIAVVDTFSTRRNRMRMDYPWAWRSPPGMLITNTERPITMCGTFCPSGCASQLLLGNFSPDSASTILQVGNDTDGPFAYYFVDNVHLHEVARIPGCVDPCPGPVIDTAGTALHPSFRPDRTTLRFDSDSILPIGADGDVLRQLADLLLADPALQLRITGHADDSGTSAHNQVLAQARADRVRSTLEHLGVPADRTMVLSMGSTQPVGDNATPEGRALNRRVEVELVR
ncbi:MAG TPA: OmpA family protein [Flavobacteriales bacterium]|nr:OmpA family protein [Flavobacteriales bacterium]